jgi:hypothetical protein
MGLINLHKAQGLQDKAGKAHILLGVWGESFIKNFLEFSLPGLLAPGNIPALAANYQLTFVLLTLPSDIHRFESSPLFKQLQQYCTVEFISIKDLILHGKYATTLTLAFDRAIRKTGDEMLNTYFIFLTADYIMADGSMQGLMRMIAKGYSGICAGNFQVNKEELDPLLAPYMDANTGVMSISPRELLQHSLPNLHTVTYASSIDQQQVHNYKSNRFFLRYDPEVLAGRFYLLHMLCIKPETTEYRLGAFCDYAFIPEMCPSGNIGIINDSDDYLVVETQSREHELEVISWGPYQAPKLISALKEWTTAQHRLNANHSIYFHTRDITADEKSIIEEKLSHFIDELDNDLQKYPPQPYYNHPYYLLDELQKQGRLHDFLNQYEDHDYVNYQALSHCSAVKKLFFQLVGEAPRVYPWHYRWQEYQATMAAIKKFIPTEQDKTLVVYGSYQQGFMGYRHWLQQDMQITHHYLLNSLRASTNKIKQLQANQFQSCVVIESLNGMTDIKNTLALVHQLVHENGKVLLLLLNDSSLNKSNNLQIEFMHRISSFGNTNFQIVDVASIHSQMTKWGGAITAKINRAFSYSKKSRFLAYLLIGTPLSFFTLIFNGLSWMVKGRGHCTTILVTLTAEQARGL